MDNQVSQFSHFFSKRSDATPNEMTKSNQFLGLLFASLLAMTGVSANAKVIKVTTTEDQNGEDDSKCSLREAVHASLAKEAYGGCEAGQKYYVDFIDLKAGTYALNSEIDIVQRVEKFGRSLSIRGADFIDYTKRDDISGRVGKNLKPNVTITSTNGNRLFNSLQSGIGLTVSNVMIKNVGSQKIDRGGAFLVGGSLSLNNVFIQNSRAANQGGAIFLEGKDSELTANKLLIQNSVAKQGAAISQFCQDNLVSDERSIDIKNASIVQNTATGANSSIIYGCGAQKLKLNNVTLANNTSSKATLDMSNLQTFQSGGGIVAPKIEIEHISMLNNRTGLAYTNLGQFSIANSILAFNGKDCTYFANTVKTNRFNRIDFRNNLLTNNNSCTLPPRTTADGQRITDKSNTYVSNTTYTNYLVAGLKNYGYGLLGYMPIPQQNNPIVNTQNKNLCKGFDKRGIKRNQTNNDDSSSSICYKGSLSPSSLVAVDDIDNINMEYATVIKNYKNRIEAKAPNNLSKKDLAVFNDVTEQFKAELEMIKAAFANTDKNFVKRVALVDIFKNDFAHETFTSSGSQIDKFPLLRSKGKVDGANNYSVSVSLIGTGTDDDKFNNKGQRILNIEAGSANNIMCQWLPQYGRLIAYRRDNSITPTGKFDWCLYTVTHNKTGKKSTAYVKFKIANKAPIAKNITIETDGYEDKVSIDITKHISDDNDAPNREGEAPMYLSENSGNPIYVEITKQPEIGRLVFADSEVIDCPVADKLQTNVGKCYAAKMNYVRYSTQTGFGDTFKYKVYDCGASKRQKNINIYDPANPSVVKEVKTINECDAKTALVSNEATVTINARTNSDKKSIIEGGGSFGFGFYILLSLFGLSGLAANKKD